MENKIVEVKLSAPEVVEAIRFLGEAILKANFQEQRQQKQTSGEEDFEQLQMELSPIKLEDLRKRLVTLSNDGRREQIRALIEKYGATKLTEVPEEKYEELLREAEKC